MRKKLFTFFLALAASVGMSWATTTDLASITGDYTAQDGEILTGTLGVNVKISIADGATVTLLNANINGDKTWTTGEYAGLTCLGDATITIVGKNSVSGFYADELGNGYPGIYVPSGKTLIINGTGSLKAQSSTEEAAGIGARKDTHCGNIEIQSGKITAIACGEYGAGIGGAYNASCGDITISGGIVTAVGGDHCPGIGGGRRGAKTDAGHCGNILISGGVVSATSGEQAAAIGGGRGNNINYKTNCGTITITNTALKVYAEQGGEKGSTNTIGAAKYGNCGAVTIGGNTGVINDDPYTYRTKEDGEIVVVYINAIGTVAYTQECKDKIDIARELYDALEDSQKTLVTNYQVLLDAEAAYAALIPQPATATTITWNASKVSSMAMNVSSGSDSRTSDGITVTAVSTGEFVVFGDHGGAIEIGNGEGSGGGYLTFTSSVGNITRIDINHWDTGGWSNANAGWPSPYYETFEGGTFTWSGTPAASVTLTGDAPRYIWGITSIVFTIEGGGSTPATGLQVVEVTSDLYDGWKSNSNPFTVNALPGFQAVTFDEAKEWTGVPTSGTAVLVYRTNGDNARVIQFFDGTITDDYDIETDFNQIYENITIFGNRYFYTVGGGSPAPANSCGGGLTWELNNGELVISYDGEGTGVMNDYDIPNDNPAPWYANRENITSVSLPEGIKTIGKDAFRDCVNLTTVTIPNSVTTIGESAFVTVEHLETVTIGTGITSIVNGAFYGNAELTTVTCSATTPPSIGMMVFGSCPNLEHIYVPTESVDAYKTAWSDYASIISAAAPANSCGGGLTWELSEGVLTISYDGEGTGEMYDFGYEYDENPVNVAPWKENKSDITTVVIGDGVKSIGNHAFNDLGENFTAVTIANSVERIGLSAFMNSKEITEMTLPSSLKTIDKEGLANCGFTSITIPSGVTSIGTRAFSYCRNLTSLTCEATTPPTLDLGVFSGISGKQNIPLYVPSESVAAYQDADQWNAFNVQAIPAPQPELAECGLVWTGVPEGGVVGTIGHEDEVVLPQLYATNPDFIDALMGGTATVRLGSTDESVLKVLGFNNFQAIAAGECDVYAVHDEDAVFAYDSVAFHVTIKPAEEPATGYAEIIFLEAIGKDDLAADASFGLLGTDFSVTITDTDNKMSIDANSCRFGGAEDYKSYSFRLKSGGKSSSKNFITLNIPAAGKLRLAVRSGNNEATDRNLVITQGEKELYNAVIQESMATEVTEGETQVKVYPYVEVAVAAGTVRLTYPVNGLNFYSFGFMEVSTPTDVESVESQKSKVESVKVIRDGQLLIIRDGKTYNVMGAVVR